MNRSANDIENNMYWGGYSAVATPMACPDWQELLRMNHFSPSFRMDYWARRDQMFAESRKRIKRELAKGKDLYEIIRRTPSPRRN